MIRELTEADTAEFFDVCIIGGGAAGLAIAGALASTKLRILVLEAGERKRSDAAQEHFRGEIAGPHAHDPLHVFRVRALGGSTQIWGGRCIPYDPIDFADRPWVPVPGWPITLAELHPYYERAHEAAEAGSFDYTPDGPMVPGLDGDKIVTTIERFSRPTDFSRRYGEILEQSSNIVVALNAQATGIRLSPTGSHVDHIEVAMPDGRRLRVRAADYVLAAGGLESTRLLLASNDVQPNGVGNAHGWLGRCYMCHTSAVYGVVTFTGRSGAILADYERDRDGVYLRRRLSVTEAAQRELQILNLTFRTNIPEISNPAHGNPALSLVYLVRYFVKYEYSRKLREAKLTPAQHAQHFANVFLHPIRFGRFVVHWIHKRYLSDRRIPSIVLDAPGNRHWLEFHAEQAPNPESRVMLAEERDAFGLPRLRVDWRVTPLDIESVKQSYKLLASELQRTGTGKLEFDEAKLEDVVVSAGAYGGHHIGTARMSARPEDGVVDTDCRVHGVSNLFVSGAAVMPTSSQANPTLTVLALAFRLVDHLQSRAAAASSSGAAAA